MTKKKKIKGVLGVDIYFDHFYDFLSNLEVGKTGQVFIINNSGKIVATSTPNEKFIQDDNTLDEEFKITNSNNVLNRETGKFLLSNFNNNLARIDRSQQLKYKFQRENYFVQVSPFKDEYGLDWLIVVVVPESDFMEQIHANTRNTIILCIITLIVAIYIGILTTQWITRPILKINLAAKSLAKGYWGQKIRIDRKDELGQLARSFNIMASQLQQSFTILEESNRTLEQKVLDRTKELSQTVELLKATQEKLIFENSLLKDTEKEKYQYQIGGTLPIKSPTYVVRKADRLLYKTLKKGQFCYIFNARQMGKSSLRAKIMHQLISEGYVCAALDLTEILSDNTTEDQLYNSIIFSLAKKICLFPEFNYRTWKKNLDSLSSAEKLGEFIEEILLKKIAQKIIIFIDEIDAVLTLNFNCALAKGEIRSADRFFAFLRTLYNKRADNSEYNRLTLVLIGRTAPHYLIKNPENTAFNIGCGIALEGFKIDEVSRSLTNGLRDNCDRPYVTIKEVLAWTGGQPFLTQKICNLIRASQIRVLEGKESLFVEQLIIKEIIENWENKDEPEHLKTIRELLTKNKDNPRLLLETYREILVTGEIKDKKNWENIELFLSGIVRKEAGKLKVYNRIYETVFNLDWVDIEIQKLSDRVQEF
ncbi:MAG: AAA-like domain-containing protein [Prochloraceae cyanobacterium]